MLQTKEKGNKAQKIAAAQRQTVQWLVDSYEIVQGGSYPKAEVYKDYLVFCKENGLSPTTAPAFGKVIRMAFPNLQCRRKGPRGEAKHHYRNFARKSKGDASGQSVLHSVGPSKMVKYEESSFVPSTTQPARVASSPRPYLQNTGAPIELPGQQTEPRAALPSLMSDDNGPRVLGKKRLWEPASNRAEMGYSSRKEPRVMSPTGFADNPSFFNSADSVVSVPYSEVEGKERSPNSEKLLRRNSLTSITSLLTAPPPEMVNHYNLLGRRRSITPPPNCPSTDDTRDSDDITGLYLPPIDESQGDSARLPEWFLRNKGPSATSGKLKETTEGGGDEKKGAASPEEVSPEFKKDFADYLEAAAKDVDKKALLKHLRLSHAKLMEKEKEVQFLNKKLKTLQDLLVQDHDSVPMRDHEREAQQAEAREIEELVSIQKKWLQDKGREWGIQFQQARDKDFQWEAEEAPEEPERETERVSEKPLLGRGDKHRDPLRLDSAAGTFEQLKKSHLQSFEHQHQHQHQHPHQQQYLHHHHQQHQHYQQQHEREQQSLRERQMSELQQWKGPNDLYGSDSDGVRALVAASHILSAEMSMGAQQKEPSPPPKADREASQEATPSKAQAAATGNKKKDAVPLVLRWIRSTYERLDPNDPPSDVPKEEVYENYRQFCLAQGIQHTNSATFGKLLRSVFPDLKTRRLGSRGNTKHHYNGIRMIRDPRLPLDASDTTSPPQTNTHSPSQSSPSSPSIPTNTNVHSNNQPASSPSIHTTQQPSPPSGNIVHKQSSYPSLPSLFTPSPSRPSQPQPLQHNNEQPHQPLAHLLSLAGQQSPQHPPPKVVIPIPRRLLSSSTTTTTTTSTTNSSQSSSESTTPQPSSPPSPSSSSPPSPPNQQPPPSGSSPGYTLMYFRPNSTNETTIAK